MLIHDIACDEVPLLLDGARQFFGEGKLMGELNPVSFVAGWQKLLLGGGGVLLGAYRGRELVGAIGGVIFPDFPTGDLVAQEFFWFMIGGQRGNGLRLLRAFEMRAAVHGAKRILMMHLADLNSEPMSKLYSRMGYTHRENVYSKNL